MKKLSILIFLSVVTITNSQTFQLDTNFGNNGFATLPLNSDGNSKILNKTQSDGKILISGQRLNGSIREDFIARYNQNGIIDTTFGENGFYIFDDLINDFDGPNFFVLRNDHIIGIIDDVKGEITKLTANGTIDNSFGNNGKMNLNYFNSGSPYLDANDNLFIGTGRAYELIKINTTNGIFDSAFGDKGKIDLANTFFNDIYSLNNNKFLVQSFNSDYSIIPTTNTYTIKSFNIDGSIDTTFGMNGTLALYTTTDLNDFDNLNFIVNVDPNYGFIYVTESNSNSLTSATKKFDIDGNQLLSFGINGVITIPTNNYIIDAKLYNNKLYFSGVNIFNSTYNTSILVYSTNGEIDTIEPYIENTNSFNESALSININKDGSLIISGEYIDGDNKKIYLAKYIISNLNVTSFDKEFDLKYQNPIENNLEFISNKSISLIILYNLVGNQIAISYNNKLNINHLDGGIYIAKIVSSENEVKIVKLVKN